ncbi:MAG: hypothetical protein IIY04_00675, partial [Oscillospiraceae bacterium]|nr:hypothetical protein [Oscillospiraceae bacterium]
MKKVKRLAALLLALVLLMTPIISVQAKETIGTAKDKTLYYFDLEGFLNEAENDKVHYDYLKLATALQGLANRDEPRLYFRYYDMEETDFAMEHLTDHVEKWWLEQITDKSNGYGKLKDGGDLAGYKIVEVKEYWNLFSLFKDCYEGIVLWDEDVPATANVASTIAGVENLLPVRFSNGENDVYICMLKHGFGTTDVKRNLHALFSGSGYIPTLGSSVPGAKMEYTTTPSTQSVKTDPYLWAKMFYLDTGLTNPTMMSFSIDGGSWEYNRNNFIKDPSHKIMGELISASIPNQMKPGERRAVSFTYENIGETEWTWANFDRLAISTDGIPADGDDFDFYIGAEGNEGYTSNHDRLFLGQKEQINPGQRAQFKGYLQAPRTQGTYKVQFIMWNDLEGPISAILKHTIEVTSDARPDAGPQIPAYHPLEKTRYEDAEFDAEIIMAGIPAVVEPKQSVTAKVVVRNIGTSAWKAGEVSLACGTQSVPLAADTASGKTANFVVNFTAPGAEGDFSLTLQMKNGSSNMGDAYECKLKAEKPETVADYDCEVVSVKYEKGLEVGAKSASYVEVVNTGSKTWTLADSIKLVEAHGEQYMSTTAHDDDAGALLCELAMEDGVEVKPGEHYFFHFDLHSYTNTGAGKLYLEPESILDLELKMTGKNGAFGDAASINLITYEQCQWPVKTFAEANDVPMSSKDRDATILWASVPKSIEAGTTEPFRVAIKNTGTVAWTRHVGLAEYNMVNLGINSGTMRFATAADGTNADSGDKNRLRIPYGLTVQPGEVLVMSGYLLAPEGTLAGTYDYDLHCVVDSATAGVGG